MPFIVKKTLFSLFIISSIAGAEIDSFTTRFYPLEDMTVEINEVANRYLKIGIKNANLKDHKKGKHCSKKYLYKQLRKLFRNHVFGEFTNAINNDPSIDRHTIPFHHSIFRKFYPWESIIQGGLSRIKDPSAKLYKVNGVFIGSDKFEHFLGSGFDYFQNVYLKGKSLASVLKKGHKIEGGIMGSTTTGVYAWADIVANYNGMRFWNQMLMTGEDLLDPNFKVGPYISCGQDGWQAANPIDFSDYVDDAFDEGINCSWFRTKSLTRKIKYQMKRISIKTGKTVTCPMDPQKLKDMVDKYKDLPVKIINTKGQRAYK